MKVVRVSAAARELAVSEAWLRRAESRGRIPPARRDINGWRVYTIDDIERVRRLLFPTAPGDHKESPQDG